MDLSSYYKTKANKNKNLVQENFQYILKIKEIFDDF